jgi:transcriptional regulator with XRE-family HTH domain
MNHEPDVRPHGAAIRAIRKKDRRTVGDVARYAGLKAQSLTNIENGQRSTTREVIEKIAEILGVPVAAITHKDACVDAAEDESETAGVAA